MSDTIKGGCDRCQKVRVGDVLVQHVVITGTHADGTPSAKAVGAVSSFAVHRQSGREKLPGRPSGGPFEHTDEGALRLIAQLVR